MLGTASSLHRKRKGLFLVMSENGCNLVWPLKLDFEFPVTCLSYEIWPACFIITNNLKKLCPMPYTYKIVNKLSLYELKMSDRKGKSIKHQIRVPSKNQRSVVNQLKLGYVDWAHH